MAGENNAAVRLHVSIEQRGAGRPGAVWWLDRLLSHRIEDHWKIPDDIRGSKGSFGERPVDRPVRVQANKMVERVLSKILDQEFAVLLYSQHLAPDIDRA